MKHDRMIYFCLCRYRDGLAWAERSAERTNRGDTLEDILNGSLPNVLQVIELNYVEFISRDVTEDFLPKALRDVIRDKITAEQDHARDLRKNWVA